MNKPIRLNVMGKTLEMQGEDAELILGALQIEKSLRLEAVKERNQLRAELLETASLIAGIVNMPGFQEQPLAVRFAVKAAQNMLSKYATPDNADKPVPLQIIMP